MKRQNRRLEKLEQGYNLNDKRFPLHIIIETLIAGKPMDPPEITEVVINGDGSETITENGEVRRITKDGTEIITENGEVRNSA